MRGYIHCYTGDGKGKTTAAAGLALRASGQGLRVLFLQFLKDGSSGEIPVLRSIPGITCRSCPWNYGFFKNMTETEKREAKELCRTYFASAVPEAADYDLLVLDEFMAAYNLGLLDREAALRFLDTKPESLEIALTGRDAPQEIRERSAYVTEFRKVKHPFDQGILARRGIEY